MSIDNAIIQPLCTDSKQILSSCCNVNIGDLIHAFIQGFTGLSVTSIVEWSLLVVSVLAWEAWRAFLSCFSYRPVVNQSHLTMYVVMRLCMNGLHERANQNRMISPTRP